MKTFLQYFLQYRLLGQVIFEYILYPIYFIILLISFFYIRSFFIVITIKWCFCWYSWWWGFFPVFSWSWIRITLIHSRHPSNRHWSKIIGLRTTATAWLLASKRLLKRNIAWKRMIRGHVNLVICLN